MKLQPALLSILALFFGTPDGFSQPNPIAPPQNPLLDYVQTHPGKTYLGNYMGGRKVGWDSDEIKIITYQGKPAAQQTQESHFKALFAGQKTISFEKTETIYSLLGDGPILRIHLAREENGIKKSKTLALEGNTYVLQTSFGTDNQRKPAPAPKETLKSQVDFKSWLASDLKPGANFSCITTALEEDDFNITTKFIFRKKLNFPGRGNELFPFVEQITHGAVFKALLDKQGNIIQGRMGKLMELRQENQNSVKDIPEPLADLIDLTAVPLDKALGEARQITMLKLKVQTEDDLPLPQSHRQSLQPLGANTFEILLLRDFLTKEAKPLIDKEKRTFLVPSNSIRSEDTRIKKLSSALIQENDSILEKSRKLSSWVFLNLEKTLASNSDNALEVLSKMKGDCTEHTLLFVSLARSQGIPAREVGGLAYMNNDKDPRMAWHAWAEIHDGRQWITVDPTWNQVLVDGTHWKFSEGQTDMQWLNVLGGIQVKVVEFKSSPAQPKGK